jgi:hypothetical protein
LSAGQTQGLSGAQPRRLHYLNYFKLKMSLGDVDDTGLCND